jgi:NTP pyrophosphatase (non-canonical NTP hydrolase)
MEDTFSVLTDLVLRFRDERDWARFHTAKDLALGMLIEAGELGELVLWKTEAEVDVGLAEGDLRGRAADELADVQVFLLYLARRLGVRLDAAVREKVAKNAVRYPVEKARGNARKHSDPE